MRSKWTKGKYNFTKIEEIKVWGKNIWWEKSYFSIPKLTALLNKLQKLWKYSNFGGQQVWGVNALRENETLLKLRRKKYQD